MNPSLIFWLVLLLIQRSSQDDVFTQLGSWMNATYKDSSTHGFGMKLLETLPCGEDEDSTWAYKYAGPKQRKFKPMNGVDISITLPLQGKAKGFDVGLKTGICLKLGDSSIAEVHGSFVDGHFSGEGEVRFRNGTFVRSTFVKGTSVGRINYFYQERDVEEYQPSVWMGLRLGDTLFRVANQGIIVSRDGDKEVVYLSSNSIIKCLESKEHPDMLFRCRHLKNVKLLDMKDNQILSYEMSSNDAETTFDFDTSNGKTTHLVNHIIRNFIYEGKNSPLDSLYYDTDPVQENHGTPILSNWKFIEKWESMYYFSASNFLDGDNQTFRTSERRLIGIKTLAFTSAEGVISEIQGHFVQEGVLEGTVKIVFQNRSMMEATVQRNYMHGPVRFLQFKTNAKTKILYGNEGDNYIVESLVIYSQGDKVGPSFYFMPQSDSFLFKEKEDDKSTKGIYVPLSRINDTLITCYEGEFRGSLLEKGHLVALVDYSVQNKLIIPIVKAVSNQTLLPNEPLVNPLIEDPIESSMVYVNKSAIHGEGLFAKRPIPQGTRLAYFGGYRLSLDDWRSLNLIFPQYWIKTIKTNEVFYLPDELGADTSRYRATLGHKINHSFDRYNSQFILTHHPRYKSLVIGVEALVDISQGEEILCFYLEDFSEGNPWFQDSWKESYDEDVGSEHATGYMEDDSKPGERIRPMLANAELYKEFMDYAINELKLSPFV